MLSSGSRGQWEAARALGLSYPRTIRRVVVPQAIRILRAPYMSLTTHVVKSTTLVSAVGVQELLFRADHAVAARGHPIEVYFIAAIFYIAINSAILVAGGLSGRTTDVIRRGDLAP